MVQLLAFSLQDQVEKYGAYIGIAAFFGLAVLSLLYFSQARELRRLRDWAGRAPERAAEVEARVVAQAEAARRVQAEPVGQPQTAAAGAATAAAGGAAAASTVTGEQATQVVEPGQEQAGNGTAAAAAAGSAAAAGAVAGESPNGGEPPAQDGDNEAEPAAVAESEAAADASAEADVEDASAEPSEADEEPSAEPLVEEPVAEPSEADEEPSAEPAGGAHAAGNGSPGEIPVAPVPRATPLPRRAPAPAAPLRQPSRSATVPPRRPAAPGRAATLARKASPSSFSRAPLIGIAAGVLVVAVVALFATGVIGGGDDTAPPQPNNTPSADTSGTAAETPAEELTPAATKVAVLNGTTIPGLASTEKDKLSEAGYTGDITTGNNTDQQRADSSVHYGTRPGAGAQARNVAETLDISDVQRLDADTRELGENADVVVILGQDKAP
jgi:hypothetical protein